MAGQNIPRLIALPKTKTAISVASWATLAVSVGASHLVTEAVIEPVRGQEDVTTQNLVRLVSVLGVFQQGKNARGRGRHTCLKSDVDELQPDGYEMTQHQRP